MKEHLQVLVKDSHILKRAVAIQHERQVEHEARKAEVEEMKGVVGQYEEQLRSLQVWGIGYIQRTRVVLHKQ